MLDPTELTAMLGMDVLEKRKHVHMDVCMHACLCQQQKTIHDRTIMLKWFREIHIVSGVAKFLGA
jgi:hypothetical protein